MKGDVSSYLNKCFYVNNQGKNSFYTIGGDRRLVIAPKGPDHGKEAEFVVGLTPDQYDIFSRIYDYIIIGEEPRKGRIVVSGSLSEAERQAEIKRRVDGLLRSKGSVPNHGLHLVFGITLEEAVASNRPAIMPGVIDHVF